jgi:predicted GTPase
VGSLRDVYAKYEVGPVLPAMGYSSQQLAEMRQMIGAAKPDLVVIASPIDLSRLIDLQAPSVRVSYDLKEAPGSPTVQDALAPVLGR